MGTLLLGSAHDDLGLAAGAASGRVVPAYLTEAGRSTVYIPAESSK